LDTRLLQLTRIDNDIYYKFRLEFPNFAVNVIEEITLKSEDARAVSITANDVVYKVIIVYLAP